MCFTSDQFSAASTAFESQLAAFNALTTIALQGAGMVVALNVAVIRASVDDCVTAANDLCAAKDPQAFFALATHTRPGAEKIADYGRQFTDVMSSTNAKLARVTDEQVAWAQGNLSAMADRIANSAPAGSDDVIAMMKLSIADAQARYEHLSKVAKQAVAPE